MSPGNKVSITEAMRELSEEIVRLRAENERLRALLDSRPRQWWLPWEPQEVARRFHLAYEHFAPDFGYETRPDTKVFDPYSANGQLMIAVVRNVLIEQASSKGTEELERLRADLAAARAECEEQARLNGMGAERELKLQTDLAAARAESDMAHWLLRNARKYMNPMHEALCAAIDNALQKKQAAIVMERSEVAGEDLAVPSGGLEGGPEEERIEAAYWRFDARHKGYGQWKNAPMSERDAFKAEMRNALGAEKTRAEMRLVASGWRKPAALSGERREGE